MNRLWTIFLVVAVGIMAVMIAYQFFTSINGGNVTFSGSVAQINSDLGVSGLQAFRPLAQNQIVNDTALDGK